LVNAAADQVDVMLTTLRTSSIPVMPGIPREYRGRECRALPATAHPAVGAPGEVPHAIRREGEIAIKELEYDEFEVLLERSGDGYTSRVVDSPTGPVPALPFVPPEPLGGLPALRLAVRGEVDTATGATTPPTTPKQFGSDLFRALFNDKALAILRTSQYVSAKNQRGLRLRIRFADATQLANLPWELLYDPDRHWYPCQLSRFPTIRFVDLPEPVLPLRVTGPLRMLVVISSPIDLPVLDVEREWTLLRTELEPLVRSGRLELERLPLASLEDVRETLMARDFHIFHYIGHGGVDADTGEGHLAFTGSDGRQRRVTGSQLGVMLSNAPIRLAVLNSCEGGRVSDVDPYASTAIALVEQGIPAVVAMQFQITDVAATAFSRTLYDSVTAGRPVDLSVTLARQAVLAASENEWATPVLYLRAVDGVLFDITPRGAPAVAQPLVAAAAAVPVPETRTPEPGTPEPRTPEPRTPEPRAPEAPAEPQHLRARVIDGAVDLVWQQPPDDGMPVRAWEVWRNGVRHATVGHPTVLDQPPVPGEYHYSVVALGDGDARSVRSRTCTVYVPKSSARPVARPAPAAPARPAAYGTGGHGGGGGPSAGRAAPAHWPEEDDAIVAGHPVRRKRRTGWILLLLAAAALVLWLIFRPADEPIGGGAQVPSSSDSGPSEGGGVLPPPEPPALTANLSITGPSPREGAGSGETDLTYEIANAGPDVSTGVTVRISLEGEGTGDLRWATLARPGDPEAQACNVDTDADTATCDVGEHAVEAVATVVATVTLGDPPVAVVATVTSETDDSDTGNNEARYP
jgi:hypothetical protein